MMIKNDAGAIRVFERLTYDKHGVAGVTKFTIQIDPEKLAAYFSGKVRRSKRGISMIQGGAIIARKIGS